MTTSDSTMTPLPPPSLDSSIPPDLLGSPDEAVTSPPVSTRIAELPFDQLTWQNFERLVYRLAALEADVEYCARSGRSGQAQYGVDVFARLLSGRYVCWQAKNCESFSSADTEAAVDAFLNGRWAARSDRFILCVRASLADTETQNAIEAQAERMRSIGIAFEALDGTLLTERLRAHPALVDDFFGRPWVAALLGDEVARSLRQRLDASRAIALRKRLADIYDVRFRQLDPEPTLGPGSAGFDIRCRFVIPDVDAVSPFAEEAGEVATPIDTSLSESLDTEVTFDGWRTERADSRARNEPTQIPRTSLGDWLLQGRRSLLLGGPGSGKSTALRCLALDLIRIPSVFPRVAARLSPRIPILIPFALWTRLTQKHDREIGLPEIVRATYGAFVPNSELESSFLEALFDQRLMLLVDGLDEYANEQAARLALATIEAFVRTHDVVTVMTGRPAGLRRLNGLSADWQVARLAELSLVQQRELATHLLTQEGDEGPASVVSRTSLAIRVDQFFHQLERAGGLQAMAGTPLLLHGLLSVAARQAILPRTRFLLFRQLIEVLLDVHPNRRATAAAEVQARTRAFADDDQRREALARLAFVIQTRGADSGIEREDARVVVEELLEEPTGAGWSREHARLGAAELVNVDADTSGLLVERGPAQISFCHAAFREHLAGLHLATWSLDQQLSFARLHADDPRWRGAILTLLQSLTRQTEVEGILQAIHEGIRHDNEGIDRRLLLADAAFAAASRAGVTGQRIAFESLDQIEDGFNDSERMELLHLAVDGPRAGPIGDEITARLRRWWPGVSKWRRDVYFEIGAWKKDPSLQRALWLGLHDDDRGNQLAASSALAKAYGGAEQVGEQLETLGSQASDPAMRAVALDALSRGWPSSKRLDDWLEQSCDAPSSFLRAVAVLARVRRGWRDDNARDALLDTLDLDFWLNGALEAEAVAALEDGWCTDQELHAACWESLGRQGPRRRALGVDSARSILLRCHMHAPGVALWVAEEFQRDGGAFSMLDNATLVGPILARAPEAARAADGWFANREQVEAHYQAAQLAAVYRSEAAKQAMLRQLEKSDGFSFWPVWSLLEGWGMSDPEVAVALGKAASQPPSFLQYVAAELPAILRDHERTRRQLLSICELPTVERPDFVIEGFANLGCSADDSAVVSAVLRHVPAVTGSDTGVTALIRHFHGDPRVRTFALQRLGGRSPPLAVIAASYRDDALIRTALLRRVSPLPTVLRRAVAKRAAQRSDDTALSEVLEQCDLEEDGYAKVQATIGFAHAALADPAEIEARAVSLTSQLHAIGPDMDERRVAAFAGLLALGKLGDFAKAVERHNEAPLRIDLFSVGGHFAPALELVAERWEDIEKALGETVFERLSKWGNEPSRAWALLAPYLSRSAVLTTRFFEYCSDPRTVLRAPAILALERVRPGSPLLFDCCLRALHAGEHDHSNPFDQARTTAVAAQRLASSFANDARSLPALVRSAESSASGTAFVGLCAKWPDHEVVVRAQREIEQFGNPGRYTWSSLMWLAASQGRVENFVERAARFVTRPDVGIWDFAADTLAAIKFRLERDTPACEAFARLATDEDDPSLRASLPAVLTSVPGRLERGAVLSSFSITRRDAKVCHEWGLTSRRTASGELSTFSAAAEGSPG